MTDRYYYGTAFVKLDVKEYITVRFRYLGVWFVIRIEINIFVQFNIKFSLFRLSWSVKILYFYCLIKNIFLGFDCFNTKYGFLCY